MTHKVARHLLVIVAAVSITVLAGCPLECPGRSSRDRRAEFVAVGTRPVRTRIVRAWPD